MFEKLKSRKLWATVFGVTFATLGEQLGFNPESVKYVAGIIGTYVLGQGVADAGAGKSQISK